MSSSSSPVHPLKQRAKKEALWLWHTEASSNIIWSTWSTRRLLHCRIYSPFFIYSYLSYLSLLFSFYYYKKREQQTLDIFHDFQLLLQHQIRVHSHLPPTQFSMALLLVGWLLLLPNCFRRAHVCTQERERERSWLTFRMRFRRRKRQQCRTCSFSSSHNWDSFWPAVQLRPSLDPSPQSVEHKKETHKPKKKANKWHVDFIFQMERRKRDTHIVYN